MMDQLVQHQRPITPDLSFFSEEFHELVEIERGVGVDIEAGDDPSHVVFRDRGALTISRVVELFIVPQRIEQLRHVNIAIVVHIIELIRKQTVRSQQHQSGTVEWVPTYPEERFDLFDLLG